MLRAALVPDETVTRVANTFIIKKLVCIARLRRA
jgi:hypothetical protein